MRSAMRARMQARAGLRLPDLPTEALEINGVERTFTAVPAGGTGATLLVVLHGAGGTGLGMAALTQLHTRGPAAGCAAIFPDGIGHVWNDNRAAPRLRSRENVDDVAFIQALVEHARRKGLSDGRRVFAVGMSNGGIMAEHLARHALVELAGVVLVAASAAVPSRRASPVPRQPARFLAFHGTADPLVPYGGGPIGPFGHLVQRRSDVSGRGSAAPIEDVAADWTFLPTHPRPRVDGVADPADDLRVERLSWPGGTASPPVLYRVVGGGHAWPGGAPFLPERIVGPVARQLDTTGVILDFISA